MRAILFAIASAVCFGTTGTAQAYGPDIASSSAVGLTRIIAGGALLGLLAWQLGRRAGGAAVAPRTSGRWDVIVAGGAAVVTRGAASVVTGILEWAVRRTAPPRIWFAATGCAVIGVVLLSGLLEGTSHAVSLRGLAGSLGAALAYVLLGEQLGRLGWSGLAVLLVGVMLLARRPRPVAVSA